MPKQLSQDVVSFASILEENTADQAVRSGELPFIYPHVALMPDAHLGYGATVGSVIPTVGAIIPGAVGVDIGCGMGALATNLTVEDLGNKDLAKLRRRIEAAIPLSPGRYNKKVQPDTQEHVAFLEGYARELGVNPGQFAHNWRLQLGTLGGGNHFIEVCRDETQQIWIFLHSGSRGVGNKIARKYMSIAKDQCQADAIDLPDRDLAYLKEGSPKFTEYLNHLHWAQEFALRNRQIMLDRVHSSLESWYGKRVEITDAILCHHNYTAQEEHYGETVWLTRKGAIAAHKGTLGLIPGSMGTRSYVVRGKGNPLALHSAPHGAGRQYSRRAARARFTQADLRKRMEGIEYRDSAAFIDEIPDAYKPIDQVMEDSADLVEVVHELSQLVNVKGE